MTDKPTPGNAAANGPRDPLLRNPLTADDVPVYSNRSIRAFLDSFAALDGLVCEVGACGVEHDDERLDYLTVQVDRELWNRVREIADNPPRAVQP